MSYNSLGTYLSNIRSKQPWLVMSAANEYYLSKSIYAEVSHFYSFENRDEPENTYAIPDGCVDILFDCHKSSPSVEVFGTPLQATNIKLKKNHKYFGVRFKSGAIPNFVDIHAKDLVNASYNLIEIFPQSNQMVEGVFGSEDFSSQKAIFEKFLKDKNIRKKSDVTSQMLIYMFEKKGKLKIRELENIIGLSIRSMQRIFQADMGMSPKAFSRIIRCQSAVYDINQNEQVIISNLACDLGFSDQAHFQREFKQLVNATPLDYANRVKNNSYLEKIEYR